MISCALQPVTCLAFMSFGFSEILLIGIVALLVFGGNLPDVMRSLGRSYGKLRRSMHEFSRPVREEIRQVREMPRGDPTGTARPAPEYPDYGAPPEAAADAEPVPTKSEKSAPPIIGAADEPPPV